MALKSASISENLALIELLEQVSLDRSVPLRAQVYEFMRRAIITGKLSSGAHINEVEIAAKLGISRTPIREAVKKLSDEGLVKVLVQNGTFVSEINREQVEEAYVIRIALELASVERAAIRIDSKQIEDLEDILMAHEVALNRKRFDQAIAYDDKFHKYLSEINSFPNLWKAVDISKAQMDRCRIGALPSPGAGQQTIDDHKAVLEALKQGDASAAKTAMTVHLDRSFDNTMSYLNDLENQQSLD